MAYPFSREPVFSQTGCGAFANAEQQKARVPDEPWPRGKCLTNMDLALAACEPSPPDRSSHGLQLARVLWDTQTVDQLGVPPHPFPTRARFDFSARTHRERIHSVVCDPTQIGAARELISCMQQNVNNKERFFQNGRLFRMTFLWRKQHVAGLLPFSTALFHVEHEVILQHIVIS